jgi:hypothetical protein
MRTRRVHSALVNIFLKVPFSFLLRRRLFLKNLCCVSLLGTLLGVLETEEELVSAPYDNRNMYTACFHTASEKYALFF